MFAHAVHEPVSEMVADLSAGEPLEQSLSDVNQFLGSQDDGFTCRHVPPIAHLPLHQTPQKFVNGAQFRLSSMCSLCSRKK